MALESGTTLGSYQVTAKIGEGGMGEVYRARDTKLDRDVALKVLPQAFTSDPDRLARFEREAKVLASLNHPNIGGIHGLEESDGVRALVLEYIEGPTLADRIALGPIPVDEALPIAKQIAEALEAAHEAGVIHRDLKPANIKLKPDGTVKVLDFGLAKALDTTPEGDPSLSPTLTAAATQMGVIMGTAAYMSPEQASGALVDRGSDVWGIGVVLFEMLTGQRVFTGDTTSHVLASILKSDPEWNLLAPGTPRQLQRLLRRCLDKNPKRRLRDIRELRIGIEEVVAGGQEDGAPVQEAAASSTHWLRALPWAGAFAAAFVAGAVLWNVAGNSSPEALGVLRLNVALSAGHHVGIRGFSVPMALSPDGKHLVFVAKDATGESQLYLRELNGFEAEPLAGTEGGDAPFFSPDSQWIGFQRSSRLWRVPIAGGAPRQISDAPEVHGASWGEGGQVVFDTGLMGLSIVSADGGEPRALAAPDPAQGERQMGYPRFLPGGEAVLFGVNTDDGSRIGVVWPATGDRRLFATLRGQNARYLPSGHLVYADVSRVMAVPFDLETLSVTGAPTPVLEDVLWPPGITEGYFDTSTAGVVVHLPGNQYPGKQLVWVDRQGRTTTPIREPRDDYMYPRLSPDERQLAVGIGSAIGPDIYVLDIERGGRTRLSREGGGGIYPVWSPDGLRVSFASQLAGPWNVFWKAVGDVFGEEEPLSNSRVEQLPVSWSPDGIIVFQETTAQTGSDLWSLSLEGERGAEVVLNTRYRERAATFSPDGSLLAYVSDQSGRDEVWVQRFPVGTDRKMISTTGGLEPVWSKDGTELFYRNGNRMMGVVVETTSPMSFARPVALFERRFEAEPFLNIPHYDVASDGRFVMLMSDDRSLPTRFDVALNWFDELTQLVPVD